MGHDTTLDDIRAGLASFLVKGMHAVKAAVLLHLDALAVVVAVLHCDVVPLLAHLTLEGHLDSSIVLRHRGLLVPYLPASGEGVHFIVFSSGGGTRTRDNTIMSRVL